MTVYRYRRYRRRPETAEEKRKKNAACIKAADKARLRGRERTKYLEYCNSFSYYEDFEAPDIEDWRREEE